MGGVARAEREEEQGLVEGLSKSPGAPTMLALLALPLLAVSARGQVEERNLLEDIIEDLERQHQYPDYQYSDQMYDAEPAPPARALHQDDLCRGSQESIPRRGQAVHCSEEGDGLLDHQDPVQEIHGQIQHASSHFQVLKQQQQLAGSRGSKNFKS